MRRRRVPVLLLAGLLATAAASLAHAQGGGTLPSGTLVWILDPANCDPGLRHQPDGPFAALVFCEHAQGMQLAVVRIEPLTQTYEDAWGVHNLIWQEDRWRAAVTSFAWAPDGRRLFVATDQGGGSGAFYELDLPSRTSRQIAPRDSAASKARPGPGYVIDRLSEDRSVLYFRPLPWNVSGGAAGPDSVVLVAREPAPAAAPAKPAARKKNRK